MNLLDVLYGFCLLFFSFFFFFVLILIFVEYMCILKFFCRGWKALRKLWKQMLCRTWMSSLNNILPFEDVLYWINCHERIFLGGVCFIWTKNTSYAWWSHWLHVFLAGMCCCPQVTNTLQLCIYFFGRSGKLCV